MNKSTFKGIYDAVNLINWKTDFIKFKALLFCEVLINNYIWRNIPFNNYISIPHNYIKKFIPKRDHQDTIIKQLELHNIIIIDHKYSNGNKDKTKNISKGYKINNYLLNQSNNIILYVAPPKTINFIDISEDKNYDFLTLPLYEYTLKMLENLDITPNSYEVIEEYKFPKDKLIINDDIKDDNCGYKLFINGEKYLDKEHTISYAKKVADNLNMDLIMYKDKLYIDILNDFIEEKELQWKLINKLKVFDIENKIFRVNRNLTNIRLDTNITNLSKNILDTLTFKGEELVEIDIKNSQFAFLCTITKDLDTNFIELAQSGKLYDFTKNQLNITRLEAKQLWFQIAFGKRQIKNQSRLYSLFPKTMKWIDLYKEQNGYKSFSNLLQKKESEIMIDGLLNYLYIKGYEVLTVHDSIRVNKSISEIIKLEIINYFKSIKFICQLGDK